MLRLLHAPLHHSPPTSKQVPHIPHSTEGALVASKTYVPTPGKTICLTLLSWGTWEIFTTTNAKGLVTFVGNIPPSTS